MLTGDMLRRAAERFPEKTAVIWQDVQITYGQLEAQSNQFANALGSLGLAPGAKVAILCRNRPEYASAFFGAARSDVVFVNVSVLYSPEELQYVLEQAEAEVLLFEDAFAERVLAVLPLLPRIRHSYVIGEAQSGLPSFFSLLKGFPETPPRVSIGDADPFCITYTGGTTGRPKGVLANHRARSVTAHTVVVESKLDESDVVAIVTPLFHVAALNIMLQPAILVGATVVLLPKWDVRAFSECVRDHAVTAAFMVPTQVAMVLSDADFNAADYASWAKLNFSGAPMPDWVQQAMLERLSKVRLTQFYGQSEMGIVAVMKHEDLPGRLGSVGRQAFNADLALLDTNGKPVSQGEVGEICARGENVMLEYYRDPVQTEKFRAHGWAWSGDLATFDKDGYLSLVDRSKDMIISGGENIYPKEIEIVLYEHEAVAECAVFGVPDKTWGELPVAHVQLKPGTSVSAEALIEYCTTRLARFKRPRTVKLGDDFPRTAIGKIQKNILRDQYKQEATE
ncbi:class I adenylate-forming enzyme family protein [Ottowia thiooxydans]|uniref:class I adenylate-forming enzyme family protein n=1 Tax=Ottowia thiooxydans TaxID=219182 RepID=UPI000415DF1A|nr:AMP-binding protein [Ottowia thiooxydans]